MYVSGAITSLVCWQIANGVTGIVHHIAIVDSFRFPIITRLGNSLLVLLGRTSGRYDLCTALLMQCSTFELRIRRCQVR